MHNKAIRIIYDEHRSISAVLSGLKALAQMARARARWRYPIAPRQTRKCRRPR